MGGDNRIARGGRAGMVRSTAWYKSEKPSSVRGLALIMMVMGGLQGCSYPDALNPIEWYRDLTGASKNDDSEKTARNSENLEAGNKEPYPNLASVPPLPDRAMSTIDREKLQKGLVADRTNAQYSEEALHQGRAVPPLPGDPPAAQPVPDSSPTPPGTTTAAPGTTDAAPGTAAAAAAPAAGSTKRPAAVKGAESPPQESSLEPPKVVGTPQGETPHPSPPLPPGVGSQQSPPQQPQQQQLAAVPTPRLPRDMAPGGLQTQPAVMRAPRGKGPSVTLEAAEISFAGDGKTLSADDNQRLAEVAKLYQQGAGALRVIGYGRRGSGANAAQQELDGFGEAMDHAGTVAQALAKLGVPPDRITIQTAPELAGGGLAAGRAEVLVEY
jgi:outer membrane protein OmpA-like peptidoglycan-associated protein